MLMMTRKRKFACWNCFVNGRRSQINFMWSRCPAIVSFRIYEPVLGINSCWIPQAFTAGHIRLETLTGPASTLISLFMDTAGQNISLRFLFSCLHVSVCPAGVVCTFRLPPIAANFCAVRRKGSGRFIRFQFARLRLAVVVICLIHLIEAQSFFLHGSRRSPHYIRKESTKLSLARYGIYAPCNSPAKCFMIGPDDRRTVHNLRKEQLVLFVGCESFSKFSFYLLWNFFIASDSNRQKSQCQPKMA